MASKIQREEDPKGRLRNSITTEREERSMRLTLNSGKIRLQIVQERSICFDKGEGLNSDINTKIPEMNLPLISVAAQTVEFKEDFKPKADQSDSDFEIDPDEFIEKVDDFECMTRKAPKSKLGNNSDHSLKFSKSQDMSKWLAMQTCSRASRRTSSPR
jgi:hypothetical protein